MRKAFGAVIQDGISVSSLTSSKKTSMITESEWGTRVHILNNWNKSTTNGMSKQQFRVFRHNGYNLVKTFYIVSSNNGDVTLKKFTKKIDP